MADTAVDAVKTLKKIAIALGMKRKNTDGSVNKITTSMVLDAVSGLVKERDTLRAALEAVKIDKKRNKKLPCVDAGPDVQQTNTVYFSDGFGKKCDGVSKIPLNGGFHWDERLTAVLSRSDTNDVYKKSFSFDFQAMNLQGGKAFSHKGESFILVGALPHRPKYYCVAVERKLLECASYELMPCDLRSFDRVVLR
jgi:hypothetical protein